MASISAVILDCDGVLIDSDRVSLPILCKWLRGLGLPVGYDECVARYAGRSMAFAIADVEARLRRSLSCSAVDLLDDAINAAYRERLRPIPGATAALDGLDALGLPYCIASSS